MFYKKRIEKLEEELKKLKDEFNTYKDFRKEVRKKITDLVISTNQIDNKHFNSEKRINELEAENKKLLQFKYITENSSPIELDKVILYDGKRLKCIKISYYWENDMNRDICVFKDTKSGKEYIYKFSNLNKMSYKIHKK